MARIRHRVNSDSTDSKTQDRIEELIRQGRGLYRDNRYQAAADRFDEVLSLDPDNDVAAGFLDLIEGRIEATRQAAAQPVPALQGPRTTPVPRSTGNKREQPTPGQARITLFFNSPISEGTVIVSTDGAVMETVPFNFTRKKFGIKRKGKIFFSAHHPARLSEKLHL